MDRKWVKASPEIAPNCPRCASSNTKFCYYNNYSLSQPRYFCKGCRRYWTKGGSLRNVPVGGGCRKSRRGRSAKPALTSSPDPFMSRSNGSSVLPQDASHPKNSNGQDIDMAAVFAMFLDQNTDTDQYKQDQESDTKDQDDPFSELTSSLGSNNNEGDSFLIDCDNNDAELFGEEVAQEFSLAIDENFNNTIFDLDDLLSDQAHPDPGAMWPNLYDGAFFQSMVHHQTDQGDDHVQFPFPDDYNNQLTGSSVNVNGQRDDWSIGSCFDVSSFEVSSRP